MAHNSDTAEYITVATLGNSTDFGDLVTVHKDHGVAGNGVRGLICAGNGVSGTKII